MRALKEIYLLNKDSTKLTHDNILDNYYPNRPDTMKNMSLYAFVSNYEYKRLLCHENCLTLKNNFGFMHKRTSKQLVKFANIRPVDSESIDNYYHQLLFLFKPWQDEKKDLLSGHKNYLEAFNFAIENNLLDTEVFNQYTEQKERMEYALKKRNEIALQAKEEMETELNDTDMNIFNLGVADQQSNTVSLEDLNILITSLNSEQKVIFDSIIKVIDHQQLHMDNKCNCNKKELIKPIRKFCSGIAGTGKSHLIKAISSYIRYYYNKPDAAEWSVAILAPTGIAAFNVNGLTIHRFFKLPVFNDKDDKHWPLSDQALKIIRFYLPNLKLIIIG